MIYYFCHCMFFHVCVGKRFDLANFWEIICPFGFLLVVFDCGAVTLSASFFSFGVLDGRC